MKELIESKWEEILSLLETEYDISRVQIDTWIRTLKIYDIKDNTLYFTVDEKLGELAVKYMYKKEFDIFLLSSIRETLNDTNIENVVFDEKKNLVSPGESTVENLTEEEPEGPDTYIEAVRKNGLNPKYTFETFIVGNGNKLAHATCLAVAELPGQDNFNPLFLYGNSGLGKTHLMQSIAHYLLRKSENIRVISVPAETFTSEIVEAIRNHTTDASRENYRNVDVLLMDDVQFIINKEATQTEFFNTFNELYNNNKQIILSSDRPPKELTSLDARITSRFECGVPIDIHEPDYETRMAILRKKAEADNIKTIPDEVFDYIAENITTNVRELEGALNLLRSHVMIGEIITLASAKEILKDIVSKSNQKALTPDYIVEVVSEYMKVTPEEIKSSKRTQDVALARQTVMYFCRKNITNISLEVIGNAIGGRDHSTIISGVKRVEKKIKEDEYFANSINEMMEKLNPST